MEFKTAVQHRDRLIRTGLCYVLEREPDIEVVGTARDCVELVSLCGEERPDTVILEVDVEEWDAARLVAALCKRQRTLRVVGMHGGLSPEASRRLRQAGVRQTVAHELGVSTIIAAIRNRQLAPTMKLPIDTGPDPRSALTQREREVLGLIAHGHRAQEIAQHLQISLKTVENHKQRLFRKLDVQNQAHAVSVAMREGLLPPDARAHG